MLNNFFLLESLSLYVTSVGLSFISYGIFRSGCNFLQNLFSVVRFGIKTNVLILKSVVGVKRELI